jgi:hypothetical protein
MSPRDLIAVAAQHAQEVPQVKTDAAALDAAAPEAVSSPC